MEDFACYRRAGEILLQREAPNFAKDLPLDSISKASKIDKRSFFQNTCFEDKVANSGYDTDCFTNFGGNSMFNVKFPGQVTIH